MRRVAGGDEAALGALYDRFGRLVFSVAFAVVHDQGIAEEVTLDIFTTAWKMAGSYDPDLAQVSTWLTRLARNRAIDRLRREKVRPFHQSVSWGDAPPIADREANLPEAAAQLHLEQQRVRAAVAALPAAQQEALALAFFQGYSHSEIASLLDQPLGTVKGRIRGAMVKLRETLADAGGMVT